MRAIKCRMTALWGRAVRRMYLGMVDSIGVLQFFSRVLGSQVFVLLFCFIICLYVIFIVIYVIFYIYYTYKIYFIIYVFYNIFKIYV